MARKMHLNAFQKKQGGYLCMPQTFNEPKLSQNQLRGAYRGKKKKIEKTKRGNGDKNNT
jgi:hypothetical protein